MISSHTSIRRAVVLVYHVQAAVRKHPPPHTHAHTHLSLSQLMTGLNLNTMVGSRHTLAERRTALTACKKIQELHLSFSFFMCSIQTQKNLNKTLWAHQPTQIPVCVTFCTLVIDLLNCTFFMDPSFVNAINLSQIYGSFYICLSVTFMEEQECCNHVS